MQPYEELFGVATKLEEAARSADELLEPLQQLEDAVNQVARSFSGSWLGYHSRVYYRDLQPTPPGAHFSQEWGQEDLSYIELGSTGDWVEYDSDDVKRHIRRLARDPDLRPVRHAAEAAAKVFDHAKSEITSIIDTELEHRPDAFLSRLKSDVDALKSLSKAAVVQWYAPAGQIMTRDMVAMGQGTMVPPHIEVLSEITTIRHSFGICRAASEIATKAASHLERRNRRSRAAQRVGTNVFIGHGRSLAWRELKDFVQDRLGLPWDEFNRVPVAGVTNIARLSEMMDAAGIAFLVMTAEDEMADGGVQARMNVIHEAGLFQGRLGFTKAIVLLEEGCTEFTNIQGLGQIRFPKGNIGAAFEEVRRVLEREGLLNET